MEWLWTAALLPFLICGLMCLGGIALAALGFRRSRNHTSGGCHTSHPETAETGETVTS